MKKRPQPVHLSVGGRNLAAAHPLRPPGAQSHCWSWRMTYRDPSSGKRKFRGLGRLGTEVEVINALVVAYRQIDPAAIHEDGSNIKTVGDLLRAWFYWQEQWGPGSDTRQESQIAERTLIVYRISSQQLLKYGKSIPLRRLSKQDLLTLRDAMSQGA